MRFVFRVSCFTFLVSLWHLWQIFFSLRVCVSRFTLAFDDDQKLYKMDFFKMVCKICARCCAKMVAAQDAVQDGVQDFMQDDWRA